MIEIGTLLFLVWAHLFADFVLQTDYVAINKSKDWKVLLYHVSLYSLVFIYIGWLYALVNGVLHFITDAISSRVTSILWKREQRHWFFVVIGIDQAVHMTCLFLTYVYLV